MKWVGRVISQILYGVGISFTVKVFFDNIIHVPLGSLDYMLINQLYFYIFGGLCGLSFIWWYIDFRKVSTRFFCILAHYLVVINVGFAILYFRNETTIAKSIKLNILWIAVFLVIYCSIIIYNKILANQLTKDLQKLLDE